MRKMMVIGVFMVSCTLLGPLSVRGQAPKEWVGKRVILQFDSVLRIGNVVVDDQERRTNARGLARKTHRIYRVEQVNGPWLWLKAEGVSVTGYILAAEVIPYEQAIDYFTNQIRTNPRNHSAYISRGQIWEDKKELDLALGDYNEAIRLDPNSEVAYNNRGSAWDDKGEFDKAITDYGEAIRIEPKYALAYNNRGIAWNAKGEYDKAIADYDEAIRIEPKSALVYNNRGIAWQAKGEYDKAIADYGEAARVHPKYPSAYNNRGSVWQAKGEYDKAIADYGETIRIDPKYALAYINRGSLWQVKGDYGKAIADYGEAVHIDPKGTLATYAVILGHLAARIAKDESAAKEFLGPRARELHTSAWPYPAVRFLRGELDEAQFLALAVDTNKRTEVHCFLGLYFEMENRPETVLDNFRWVKQDGTRLSVEYRLAVGELERLEATTIAESAPHAGKPAAPKPETAETGSAKFLETALYVPTPQLEARFGTDPKPLGDYVNELKARVNAILAETEPVGAKGLLVAVGLKTDRRSKVWCQAIEGSIPAALLKTLERELADIEAIALKAGPAGFGLKFGLNGQSPDTFPKVPERWSDAAQSTRSKMLIPPDDLFKILWPD